MEEKKVFLRLQDLDVYKLAKELSETGWEIYSGLHWQIKKITGDQFIESTDSVGANIAEGYGRYHYLDRIKFYYNSRGSLLEVKHWLHLLDQRVIITKEEYTTLAMLLEKLHYQLNTFIKACYPKK